MKNNLFALLACFALLTCCSCGPREKASPEPSPSASTQSSQPEPTMPESTESTPPESTPPQSPQSETAQSEPAVPESAPSGSSATALTAPDEEARDWAKKTLAGLSLKQKIGQMICPQMQGNVAPDSAEFAKVLDMVRQNEVGSLVVYGGSPRETAALFNRLQQESKLPLFISMDFEGGPGQQLAGATEFPANMAIAAIGSEEIAYQIGQVGAAEGRACGVHITYSPVVDISTRPENPISSVRSFGGDVKLLGRMAAAYIRGYRDGGMIATAKHFPGRGDVDAIPGTKFFANNKPADRVEADEFAAFKAAIDAGVVYIMTEHVAVPSVTDGSDLPASVSKALVTGWLREKLGYKNIITTDDMWYPHVVERFGPVKACVMAIEAGHDVVLKPADVADTIDGLLEAVEGGEISQGQIDRSVEKILYHKARLNLHRNRLVDLNKIADVVASPKHTELRNMVADRSLTLLVNKGVLPVDLSKVGSIAHVSVQKNPKDPNVAVVADKLAKGLPGVRHFALGAEGADEKIRADAVEAAKSADLVVVSLLCQRNPYGDPAPIGEADAAALDEIFGAKPSATVVMSYGNPHFAERLKNAPAFLVGYGEAGWYGNQTVYADSFVRLLKGQIKPQGKLPVKVSEAFPIGAGLSTDDAPR